MRLIVDPLGGHGRTMTDYIRDLVVLVGSPAAVTAVLIFVGRKLIDSLSQRDLAKYRADLNLERIRHENKLAAIRSKRVDVIVEFYDLLATAEMESARLVKLLTMSGEPTDEEKWRRASEAAQAALEYFKRRRLFFRSETCDTVEAIFDAIRDSHLQFAMSQDQDIKNRTEKWVEADATMKNVVSDALAKLAEEFREAIGA